MFEFGKKYILRFTLFEGGKPIIVTEKNMEVVSVDTPLVKFTRDGNEYIINATSLAFFDAKKMDG